LHDFVAGLERVDEFIVAVAPRLFAVGGEEVGPARAEVAADVLHDHGDAVGVRVEGSAQLLVVELHDGSLGHLFLLAEGGDGGG